jgi:geranylgeranyl diphosphate synthase type I
MPKTTRGRFARLERYLQQVKKDVDEYLDSDEYKHRFMPAHILDAVYSYIVRTSKTLRPAVLLLSYGAAGGDGSAALPGAAGVEVYHTWTLVHDDIIDLDQKRRGQPTVHAEYLERAAAELGYDRSAAQHYGLTIAILTGDVQQAWAISLFGELHTKRSVDAALVLHLISDLTLNVQTTLVDGETLDVQYSRVPPDQLTEEAILQMLWKKTGILYEFAARAGCLIALGRWEPTHPHVSALGSFASVCGLAFQLRDDVLGITADERSLGKPVGADIREGKRTLIVHNAFETASAAQRAVLLHILGNRDASQADLDAVTHIFWETGSIDYVQRLATEYAEKARRFLAELPVSPYRDLLYEWSEFVVSRGV